MRGIPANELKEFMMCTKIKTRALCFCKTALALIKQNVAATVSLVLTIAAISLTMLCSVHSVNIYDGKNTYFMKGSPSNIPAIIEELGIGNNGYDIVTLNSSVLATSVEIKYHIPLTVKMGDSEATYYVRGGRLADMLFDAGIELDEYDIVEPAADTVISSAATINLTDIDYVTETSLESIPFGNDVIFSDNYDTNISFTTAGTAGTKACTYSVKYVNGVKAEAVLIGEDVTTHAVDSTTVYGTKAPSYAASGSVHAGKVPCISTLTAPDNLILDKSGKPIKYTKKATLRATAYTHTGNPCSTGVMPQTGYVAVDPKEIPYGTKMYIVSADGKYVYGYAVAADTGGFIYGNRTDMDLFLNSEEQCVKFGRRDIIVYFL